MKLHGMPRKVEDICNERDPWLSQNVSTCGSLPWILEVPIKMDMDRRIKNY